MELTAYALEVFGGFFSFIGEFEDSCRGLCDSPSDSKSGGGDSNKVYVLHKRVGYIVQGLARIRAKFQAGVARRPTPDFTQVHQGPPSRGGGERQDMRGFGAGSRVLNIE